MSGASAIVHCRFKMRGWAGLSRASCPTAAALLRGDLRTPDMTDNDSVSASV